MFYRVIKDVPILFEKESNRHYSRINANVIIINKNTTVEIRQYKKKRFVNVYAGYKFNYITNDYFFYMRKVPFVELIKYLEKVSPVEETFIKWFRSL